MIHRYQPSHTNNKFKLPDKKWINRNYIEDKQLKNGFSFKCLSHFRLSIGYISCLTSWTNKTVTVAHNLQFRFHIFDRFACLFTWLLNALLLTIYQLNCSRRFSIGNLYSRFSTLGVTSKNTLSKLNSLVLLFHYLIILKFYLNG